jgi:2-polyprenyl-6-methoxyphenol hydroxylase-like FAD-dependent oxidoreductase
MSAVAELADSGQEVLVAGAGIGGLVTALALHRAGAHVRVFEAVERIQALGVGINLLPHAVRELDELGVASSVLAAGLAPASLGYFTKRGEEIWREARGLAAGYHWPQISIHRGELQRVLHEAVRRRIGDDRIHTGRRVVGVDDHAGGVVVEVADRSGATLERVGGAALVAADGIHSAVRRARHPQEGPPLWNGALLWRGLAEAPRLLDGRTMVWAGHRGQKFVAYPLRDLPGDRQQINFIAELRDDGAEAPEPEDWNRPGLLDDFLPRFEGWRFDWLDVPSLIRAAPGTFVFPMVDRDPLERWSVGRVTLLGDAAHPMYPIGSNGASQAILDAQVLAGCLQREGDDVVTALARYDELRRPATSAIVHANRGMGPERPMQLVEERAPSGFAHLDDVITCAEIDELTLDYRRTAGFAVDELNARPSLADLAARP